MTKLKIPLIFSLIIFLLSFFIGLISGVNFFSIIVRSMIVAIVAGGFVILSTELFKRVIPELFEPVENTGEKTVEAETTPEAGKNVNITIDEPIDLSNDNVEGTTGPSYQESAPEIQNAGDEVEELETADDEYKDSSDDVVIGNSSSTSKQKAEELEELPNLQEFIPENGETSSGEVADFVEEGTSRFDISPDIDTTDMDIGTMANAIKTVLKKES